MKKKTTFSCRECSTEKPVDPRVPQQHTCSNPACQKKRKARNQAAYRSRDPEIKKNDRDCNRKLRERDPDYYRKWRLRHPDYVEQNRVKQRERNRRRRKAQAQGKGLKGCGQETNTVTSKAKASTPEKVAKVTGLPAYLVIPQGVGDDCLKNEPMIAKVTAIFEDPSKIQIDKKILEVIANVAR